jgi:hypothetical protein
MNIQPILKKTWEILKEAANLNTESAKISKIVANNNTLTDPKLIADEFNTFFTGVGVQISESVIPTVKQPEDYLVPDANVPELEFHTIGQNQIIDIIKLRTF